MGPTGSGGAEYFGGKAMTPQITRPALRYHGAKFRLAPWIMQFFPPHQTYVEPFAGAAGVLLQKPRAYSEVYNDADGEIVNFFRVLQDRQQRERLIELLSLTPYARAEFEIAYEPTDDPVERARRTCIRAQMGFGSAGDTKGITGFRVDSARECSTAMHLWQTFPEGLRTVAERFTGVQIENGDAISIMRRHDRPDTLFYLDPPYIHDTRVFRSPSYRHEMTNDQHIQLLEYLKTVQGMVLISGYPHSIYNDLLSGWRKETTQARMSSGRGTGRRTECLWISPAADRRLSGDLFSGTMPC